MRWNPTPIAIVLIPWSKAKDLYIIKDMVTNDKWFVIYSKIRDWFK